MDPLDPDEMPAWIAGLWFEVFPRADWAFIFLAVLNAGLGLYGSWMLIGDFAEGDRRLAATALLLLTPFYTFLALKYNANSIFLSLWPWTMHFFVRSIDNRRLVDAILFGLFPPLMVWAGRHYHHYSNDTRQLFGGRYFLTVLILFVIFEVIIEIVSQFLAR